MTEAFVAECREAFEERGDMGKAEFYRLWASKVGVSETAIRDVIKRRSWK